MGAVATIRNWPARALNAWDALAGKTKDVWLPAATSAFGGWFGGAWGGTDGDTDPGTWQRGMNRNTATVLAFSAVYACVSIISGDIAKLGRTVYRRTADGGREEHTQHPLYRLLRRPNSYQTSIDFWQYWLISTLLAGNAYVKVDYDRRFTPTSWHILDPRFVQPLVSEDGDVFYEVQQNKLAGVPETKYYTQRDIIHHRMMTLAHPLIGVTPLYACAASAMLGRAIASNSRAFFNNQSRPSGVLKAPGKIDKDTAKRLKEDWEENTRAGNSGRVMILGSGLEWQPLTVSASDSQLVEQSRMSGEDVARAFRVPTFMLGDISKTTYKNTEQLMRAYYSGCLQYHLESLEDRLDNWFELPSDVEVEFSILDLLRTEMDVRFDAYQTGLQSGFMTINEARAFEGWRAIKGGDEPLVQVQYKPLSAVIANPAGEPTVPPVKPDPNDPNQTPDPDDPNEKPDDEPAAAPADEPVEESARGISDGAITAAMLAEAAQEVRALLATLAAPEPTSTAPEPHTGPHSAASEGVA